VFTFGDAGFYGSLGASTLRAASIDTDDGVTPSQVAAWDKVNICEEGGVWNVDGPIYSGGLGFSHANWTRFNTFGYPADAAYATPIEQIRVAVAFATYYLGGPNAAPDQHGCAGGY
jgi:Transglycosylase-like domain